MSDKHVIERVARALHAAMRHTPRLQGTIRHPWEGLTPIERSEYRAVTHSALVAAGPTEVWVVTDESDRAGDHTFSSVIVVAETREAALASLAESHGGADECVWEDHDETGWWFTTQYGEYPWVMQKQTIERRDVTVRGAGGARREG